jgi:hypothetical protein
VVHVDEEWKELKEVIVETAEHTVGFKPKPENRGWFDGECNKTPVDEKSRM